MARSPAQKLYMLITNEDSLGLMIKKLKGTPEGRRLRMESMTQSYNIEDQVQYLKARRMKNVLLMEEYEEYKKEKSAGGSQIFSNKSSRQEEQKDNDKDSESHSHQFS